MDPTSAAGTGLVIAKLAAFALLVYASRKATLDVRRAKEARAAREAEEAAKAQTARTVPEANPVREAA